METGHSHCTISRTGIECWDHTGRLSANTTKELDWGCTVSYQRWRSTCERNRYDSPPFEPPECNLFNFNFALMTTYYSALAWGAMLNEVQFFCVLIFQWLPVCGYLLCCCQKMSVFVIVLRPARQHYSDRCLMQDWFTWLHYHPLLHRRIQQPD